jgi:hypothetical protein
MLRQLVAGFSPQGPGFNLTQIKVPDTVALIDVSVRKSENTYRTVFLTNLWLTTHSVIYLVRRPLTRQFFGNDF